MPEASSPDIPPPPRPIGHEGLDRASGTLLILVGVALVGLGVVLIANPFSAIWILGVLTGVALMVGGVAEVAAAGGVAGSRWAHWLVGGLLIVGGMTAAVWPDATLQVLALLAGVVLAVTGAVTLLAGLTGEREARSGRLAVGALSLVIGLIVVAWPDATLLVLAILVGLRTLVNGILCIGIGWNLRRMV